MYRDGDASAVARSIAAAEALEELGVEAQPTSLVTDHDALAERLEVELSRRRAELSAGGGPSSRWTLRELLPYWAYDMHTADPPDVVMTKLAELTSDSGPFSGAIDAGELSATCRNDQPLSLHVHVRVEPRPYGAVLHVRVGPMAIVVGLGLLGLAVSAYCGLASLFEASPRVFGFMQSHALPIIAGSLFVVWLPLGLLMLGGRVRSVHERLRGAVAPVVGSRSGL